LLCTVPSATVGDIVAAAATGTAAAAVVGIDVIATATCISVAVAVAVGTLAGGALARVVRALTAFATAVGSILAAAGTDMHTDKMCGSLTLADERADTTGMRAGIFNNRCAYCCSSVRMRRRPSAFGRNGSQK
jgi:hypothetical protein